MKNMKYLVMLFVALGMAGCGYTAGSLLPSDLKTIYLEPFRNKIELTTELTFDEYRFRSYRAQLETDINRELRDRFITDGNLKVVESEKADLILTGELIDYLRVPVRYAADNETVDEYRITIVCSAQLKKTQSDQFLWKEPRIIGDSAHILSGTTANNESVAVEAAVDDLARRIVNHTIEGW
ncbi:MAG: LptE family protein [Candidatus Omnitrophota bacterium]